MNTKGWLDWFKRPESSLPEVPVVTGEMPPPHIFCPCRKDLSQCGIWSPGVEVTALLQGEDLEDDVVLCKDCIGVFINGCIYCGCTEEQYCVECGVKQ